MIRLVLALLIAAPVFSGDWYLFTSFRGNGETGVYFALSDDGRRWTPLNDNQPWVKPAEAGMIGPEWLIYFDHYTQPQHYGAVRTTDWRTFEDITAQVSFPADHRHGTVVKISEELARRLRAPLLNR